VCSFVVSMGSVNLVVIVESVQSLITSNGELKEFHIPSIVAVGAALGERLSTCMDRPPLILYDRCQIHSFPLLLGPPQ
jgi:hypothetical protein